MVGVKYPTAKPKPASPVPIGDIHRSDAGHVVFTDSLRFGP